LAKVNPTIVDYTCTCEKIREMNLLLKVKLSLCLTKHHTMKASVLLN